MISPDQLHVSPPAWSPVNDSIIIRLDDRMCSVQGDGSGFREIEQHRRDVPEVWVRAENEAGKGERTHATVTLPSELPGPVTGLEVAATEDGVTVSWSAPETGGAEGSGRTRTPRAKKTKVSFDNLEAGRTYRVWVRAENEAGKGERVHASITLPEAEAPAENGDGQTGQ